MGGGAYDVFGTFSGSMAALFCAEGVVYRGFVICLGILMNELGWSGWIGVFSPVFFFVGRKGEVRGPPGGRGKGGAGTGRRLRGARCVFVDTLAFPSLIKRGTGEYGGNIGEVSE